jgi:hypothetical protein
VEELTPWQVTPRPTTVPRLSDSPDLEAFVTNLDPRLPRSRAVGRILRGTSPAVDAAIAARFPGVDLDVPFVVAPATGRPAAEKTAARKPEGAKDPKPKAATAAAAKPSAEGRPSGGQRRRPGRGNVRSAQRSGQPVVKKVPRAPSRSAGP